MSEVVSAGYGDSPSRFSALLFAQRVGVSATLFKQHFCSLGHFALSEWFDRLTNYALSVDELFLMVCTINIKFA